MTTPEAPAPPPTPSNADRVAALETAAASKDAVVARLQAEQAFLTLTDHDWQDTDLALAEVDLAECVGEGSTVDQSAVRKAAARLARDKPTSCASASSPTCHCRSAGCPSARGAGGPSAPSTKRPCGPSTPHSTHRPD